jgi:hypothetical protein
MAVAARHHAHQVRSFGSVARSDERPNSDCRPVSRSDNQRVQDILDAADQILDVVNDGRGIWAKDRLRQLAVERLLEIIGESANALSDDSRPAGAISLRFLLCGNESGHLSLGDERSFSVGAVLGVSPMRLPGGCGRRFA